MKNYLKKELKDRDNQLKYDFLPAMIEIIEKPANRMGVVILYTVIFLIVSTIIWACIMSIDVAVVASGTIDSDNPIITMSVKPHFIPDDFCKLFQSKSPVIKCGNDNDSKLFQS